MAVTPDAQAQNQWPVPKFHFSVTIEGDGEVVGTLSCQEITGLKVSKEPIEYRFGDDPSFTKRKIPGMKKYENITIKKGVFKDDDRMYKWYNTLITDDGGRHDMEIKLLDEEHNPVMSWRIIRAFPISVSAPDLNAESNELAIETIELAHEGIQAPDGTEGGGL